MALLLPAAYLRDQIAVQLAVLPLIQTAVYQTACCPDQRGLTEWQPTERALHELDCCLTQKGLRQLDQLCAQTECDLTGLAAAVLVLD